MQLLPRIRLRIRPRRIHIPRIRRTLKIHQKLNVLHPLISQFAAENRAGLAYSRAARDVGQDDVLILQLRGDLGELIHVHVAAGLGFALVLGVEKRALRDQNLRLADVGVVENRPGGGVAEESDLRNLQAILNLDALLAEGGDLRPGQRQIFRLELFSHVDDDVAEAHAAVVGGDGLDRHVAADFVQGAGDHGYQRVWRALAFDLAPAFQQVIDRPFQFARQQDRAGLHPLEITLRQVIRQPRQMVHVPVAEANDIAGQREVWATPDVEADIEFRGLDDGLLAAHGVADEMERPERDSGEFLNKKRLFGHGGGQVSDGGGGCRVF